MDESGQYRGISGNSDVRRVIRHGTINAIRSFIGVLYLLMGRPFIGQGLTTFVFHEISDVPGAHARDTRTFSDLKTFEEQIKWIIQLFEVQNFRENSDIGNKGGCLLSFDDGYAGVVDNALPILKKYGLPAICFINMATINGGVNSSAMAMYMAKSRGQLVNWHNSNPQFHRESLGNLIVEELDGVFRYQGPYMSEEKLRLLSENPLITIGNHLYNHWLVDALTPEEFAIELSKNSEELRKYSSYRPYFAAPHGIVSQYSLSHTLGEGYELIFAGREVQLREHQSILPRIDLNNEISTKRRLYGIIAISKMRIFLNSRKSRKITTQRINGNFG